MHPDWQSEFRTQINGICSQACYPARSMAYPLTAENSVRPNPGLAARHTGKLSVFQVKNGKLERRHGQPGGFQVIGSRPASHRKPESSRSRGVWRGEIRLGGIFGG
jgi:hypothetical protein